MSSHRRLLLACTLVLALGPATSSPAAADVFVESWNTDGWSFLFSMPTTDDDPQPELMFSSLTDGHFAIFDGLTGAIEAEFPTFTSFDSNLPSPADLDGDGRFEIIFNRFAGSPTFAVYEWTGSGYGVLFSHTEGVNSWGFSQFRGGGINDFLETSSNDVRIRDLSGTVLFRASTDLTGWVGTFVGATSVDFDGDGLDELVVIDGDRLYFVDFAAAFTESWSTNGWSFLFSMPTTDDDPQPELMFASSSDGHFAIFDGLTGVVEEEFPTFTLSDSNLPTPADLDGDGRFEVILNRFGGSPLFAVYEWTGSDYGIRFSHTDGVDGWGFAQLRGGGINDFLEISSNDVRVRDLSGAVIFLASTDLAGWVGNFVSATSVDFDGDGFDELVVYDEDRIHFVDYDGAAAVGPGDGDAFRDLWRNVPNPSRGSTNFQLSTREQGDVQIKIFDAQGRLVRGIEGTLPPGRHEIPWDGRDNAGREVSSGVFFYEMNADGRMEKKKLIIAR